MWSILHHHALGLVRVEGDLGCLGPDQADELTGVLVLLPVGAGQVVVGVVGTEVETNMVRGGVVEAASRGQRSKYLNLKGGPYVFIIIRQNTLAFVHRKLIAVTLSVE